MIDIKGAIITDLDIEIKMKISRIKYLESRFLWLSCFILIYMTVIFLTEYNTRCFGVTVQSNAKVRVQRIENMSNDKKIYYV